MNDAPHPPPPPPESPQPQTPPQPPPPEARLRRRRASRLALAAAAVALLLVALLGALVATPAGARLALRAAAGVTGGQLQVARVAGTLLGPLSLGDLRYRDAGAGVDLAIRDLRVDLVGGALLRGGVHLAGLELAGVELRLSPPTDPPDDAPVSLQPPVDVRVDRLRVEDLRIVREDAPLLEVETATAEFSWTEVGLDLRRFDLVAPQGEVHLSAELGLAERRFDGRAGGRFHWDVGGRRYAGSIDARGRDALADLQLRLAEPLAARLRLGLRQRDAFDWNFTLDVPAFDPRRRLAPDTSVARLALQLQGQGNLEGGTATGTLRVDEVEVALQPLRVARRGDDATIDATLRSGEGRLRVAGDVLLSQRPVAARLALDWQDLVLPVALAGQALRTDGRANVDGSAERYAARASGRLGPARRLADFTLELQGDAAGLELQRLDVVQAAGRLAARGTLGFGERLRWRVSAEARDFDPGAFLAQWPGRLSFAVGSEGEFGTLEDSTATLRLDALRGRLRGRAIAGRADLDLRPGLQVGGALDLRSGASRIRLDGTQGEQVDAVLRLDVPSLVDWLPDARGQLDARLTAKGQWPELRLVGTANGRGLALGDAVAAEAGLRFDVSRPLDPRGEARLRARGLRSGEVQVESLTLQVDGETAAHRVALDWRGEPVSASLRLTGALAQQQWRGEIGQLALEVPDVARLALEQPVQASWSTPTGAFDLGNACLADGEVRLCLEGRGRLEGALQARYALQRLPLALLAGLAPTPLPVAMDGSVDGDGAIRRDDQGALDGEATLRIDRSRIALAGAEEDAPAERLLDVADLRLDATFTGRDVRATLVARLDGQGSLDGSLDLTGLDAAPVGVGGRLRASLPSLAVAGAFAPQLADVDGTLQLDLGIAGTLDAPRLGGELLAAGLRADVPELGVALRDGRLRLAPQEDGRIVVDASIRSGDGELRLNGEARTDGTGRARLAGRDFLAADRPGARVLVAPDLAVTSADGRLEVGGELGIPVARIDLQRLPRGDRAQAASPDVVVIDDDVDDDAAGAAGLPLFATIDLALGDKVELAGFGLDARVGGNLQLQERPGQVTTAAGEIRVAGVYKAYGQDLTIRQGQLFYAGTPLDDPRLNLVAVRVVDEVTAGLRVTGSARAPQLEVFSDPAMGQAGALAYLVTGKPLDQIGQGDADGDALQSAARSLGTAAGGFLARNIGRRLGVSALGIEDSEAIGGAALTIGQYLSPRVFVSYGVGLFKPGEVVKLNYRISRSLALEAENATDSSRVGVEYRIER